ncbi:sister-chromatid cohesion protein 3 [Magnolia sinica]|uniref:sister-chromatid cohesion protein 3 n=1 Tax=Magnolia sinica TaxID=86752 RepID=UPI00265AE6A4|nr:sister-chromatid cohesion protein 3 [Magnolia sinica]XP_058083553.1 sister-chromatid cohesion protein 3 [Magnolia sinica]
MEDAAAASETSIRPPKRGRDLDPSDGGPSTSTHLIGEKPDQVINGSDQVPDELDQGSGDGLFDDLDELEPRTKKKRTTDAIVVHKEIDQSLIDVIKSNGKLIPHAVKNWVERYENNPKSAIVELLMMLFEACGAKYHLDEGSLDETDVDDVVVSLVNHARNGDVEDYYSSKRKELKNFKENLASFWDNLVIECQNGPLFDQVLFEKCMDYVIALSCTPPRVYRQVASLVGLQLVTSFITVAKMLGGQRETTQRQLNAEKKKRNDGPRVESLNRRLSTTHEKITVTEEMMRKIFTGLFMHRYRDIDPDIRMSCIKSLGIWIVSYPALFLQDLYLKYLGWTLNDKSAAVRKTSVLALQNLYEVDDNVPSLGLFTERFCNRMIDLADDIDVSVAVSAIGLLKQLLRHQLLADDELGPLYDLLIDEPPMIRRAIGELVYDHLIAQKFSSSSSGSRGEDTGSSEVHLGRMLQILREFSTDPILSAYVIDDVWDDMKAMKDWKCIISMLLDENPMIELTDVDATNLVRLLYQSAKKAVGEKIVPATDNRKQYYNKAQKEALENSRREITVAMMKSYPQLLRKFLADKTKVSSLVEIILYLKLELYSLKRQEQNFKTVLQLIKDAFFKHGEKTTLRSCVKAITFCSAESKAELQDFAQNKLKELENELIVKLKFAMKDAVVGDDEYSLLVNLKRLYELQLEKCVPNESVYDDLVSTLQNLKNADDEVVGFLLLNMYLHVAWSLHSVDSENPSEASVSSLLSKRTTLFEKLEYFLHTLLEVGEERKSGGLLSSRVCIILAEMWCLFRKSRFSSTKLEGVGFCPDNSIIQKFWKLCEQRLNISDETEDEDVNEEYIEETNPDTVMIAAAKLVASDTVPKDYLGPEIISHFVMHGASVAEIVKHLISALKKTANDDVPDMFLEALKRAYQRHVVELSKSDDESMSGKSLQEFKDLATRLSGTFVGAARNKHRSHILKICKDGISFAFVDAPKQLAFLEGAVLQFVSKLPTSDVLEILKDVQKRSENVNTDEDPSGWRPYYTFVEHLREKYAKNEGFQDEKEGNASKRRRRRGRPRKARNLRGRKLFDEEGSSEEEDFISASEPEEQDEEEEMEDGEEELPLIHSFRSSAKLRSMRVSQSESRGRAETADSVQAPHRDNNAS